MIHGVRIEKVTVTTARVGLRAIRDLGRTELTL
jgi:hypothetical protein